MNDLIQVIKILDQDDVDKLNSHIDTLQFIQSLVFDTGGDGVKIDNSNKVKLDELSFDQLLKALLREYKQNFALIVLSFTVISILVIAVGYNWPKTFKIANLVAFSPS